jgi:hypothetical protein
MCRIDQSEPQVKATQQLDYPLMDERLGQYDKDALCSAREVESV